MYNINRLLKFKLPVFVFNEKTFLLSRRKKKDNNNKKYFTIEGVTCIIYIYMVPENNFDQTIRSDRLSKIRKLLLIKYYTCVCRKYTVIDNRSVSVPLLGTFNFINNSTLRSSDPL